MAFWAFGILRKRYSILLRKFEMIKVKNISKQFLIPHEKRDTFREKFLGFFSPIQYEKFQALDNVSFDVKKGEWLGIVGKNGSGKSTLLKLLASIYVPDAGNIKIMGKIIPLLELGVGFHPELTVLQNIFFNATILGLTTKEVEKKVDKILDFSGLSRFRDQYLKNLSSGMQVRLAFSVAIQADGDVYLLDEILAVGDFEFQKKCEKVFEQWKKEKKTVVLVSHSMENVKKFCNQAILLEKGLLKEHNSVEIIYEKYGK